MAVEGAVLDRLTIIVLLDDIVSEEASDAMVACDIRLMMVGESNGREWVRRTSPDLERPYMSSQSSDDPASNEPVLHTEPGVPASEP